MTAPAPGRYLLELVVDRQLAPPEAVGVEARIDGAPIGVVFDGTASGFVLPSGGMRNRAGMTVVEAKDVAIGRLEVTQY